MCISLTLHTYHKSRITHGPRPHAEHYGTDGWQCVCRRRMLERYSVAAHYF